MNWKNLSVREWAVIIGGGAVVVILIFWLYVIDPGVAKLTKDKRKIFKFKQDLNEAVACRDKSKRLELEFKILDGKYSNQLGKIGNLKIPDNIEDLLTYEFDKIDQKYGSKIMSTRFTPLETNEIYNLLKYNLNNVQCDWKSLIAALYLTENSGQLVGFENIKISADARVPANVKTKANIHVKSFIFPKIGKEKWKVPDYESIENGLERDMFQMPFVMIPVKKGKPKKPGPPPGSLPSWSKSVKLTVIARLGGKKQAAFYNRSKRKECRIPVGGTISNTTAVITDINLLDETVTVIENGTEFVIPLRKYREGLIAAKSSDKLPRSQPQTASVQIDENAASVVSTDKIEVPKSYDKKVGSFTKCQQKLGAFLNKVDTFAKRKYRLGTDHGLIILRMQKGGPIMKAGAQRRDVIININGKRVDSRESFTFALNEAYGKSKSVTMAVKRKNETKFLTVELK